MQKEKEIKERVRQGKESKKARELRLAVEKERRLINAQLRKENPEENKRKKEQEKQARAVQRNGAAIKKVVHFELSERKFPAEIPPPQNPSQACNNMQSNPRG